MTGAVRESYTYHDIERAEGDEGLSFFRNRYYDAESGRFTQEDPIGFDGGLNLYAYAGNNPAAFTDPFGLSPECGGLINCLAEFARMQARGFAAGTDPLRVGLVEGEGRFGALLGRLSLVAGTGSTPSALIGRASMSTAAVGDLTLTHGITLSRREMRVLTDDIAANGIREPIKFVNVRGHKFVVDGHHRLAAARRLGIQDVPVQEVRLPYRGYRTPFDLEFQR